jgi:hypothetical protein
MASVSKRPIWPVDAAWSRHGAPADDPAHRGIAPEPVGVVHVLVAGEPTEHRLTELGEQRVAPVLPGARIDEDVAGQSSQAEGIVEFPEREQVGIGGDRRPVELQLQAAVKSDPQPVPSASPVVPSIHSPPVAANPRRS